MFGEIKELVRADFEEFLRISKDVPQELKDSMKLKERVPRFVDHLAAELKACEDAGLTITRQKIKDVTYDMAAFFIHMVKTQAQEMLLTDAAKKAKAEAAAGDPILKKFDEHGNADLTEEFGVKIVDKKH